METTSPGASCPIAPVANASLRALLNGVWHKPALQIFTVIVLAHWAEHLIQAYQIWGMGWKPAQARGVLGLFYPWLIKSEALHYGYALVMIFGIWLLRPGFKGRSLQWWTIALLIQFWHHIEHALLQGQAIAQQNLFGSPVPVSILQLWIPRVELHLFYNTVVFIPMVIGMYLHVFPPADEEPHHGCGCSVPRTQKAVTATG